MLVPLLFRSSLYISIFVPPSTIIVSHQRFPPSTFILPSLIGGLCIPFLHPSPAPSIMYLLGGKTILGTNLLLIFHIVLLLLLCFDWCFVLQDTTSHAAWSVVTSHQVYLPLQLWAGWETLHWADALCEEKTPGLSHTFSLPSVYLLLTFCLPSFPSIYLLFTFCLPTLDLLCTFFPFYLPSVNLLFNFCSPSVYLLFTFYLPSIYLLFTFCLPSVYLLFSIYLPFTFSLPSLYLFLTSSLPSLYLLFTFSLPSLYLPVTFSLPRFTSWFFVYLLFTFDLHSLYLLFTCFLPSIYRLFIFS